MYPSHPRFEIPVRLAEALLDAAEHTARAAARAGKAAMRRRRRDQQTLKPGTDTPLWNELAAAAAHHLQKRGAQAHLGRILGLPRQRVHEMLKNRRHLPDAERTLLLLVWVQARSRGEDLA